MKPEQLKQEATKRYLELQMLGQKMQELQQQAEALDQQVTNLDETMQNLADLAEVKVGTDLLVPIANGIFIKATLSDANNLLVNVGSHVNIPKTVADVKKLLTDQSKEIRGMQDQMVTQLKQLTEHAKKTEEELQKLVA